ncbi:MAG: TIM barrel protein [Verrucomicrobiales bacterium]|nr:TIM barrel protein [Verrucomicrobiales bacterium]
MKTLAEALIEFLAENFKGRLVGPRPRFTALATYWPLISLPAAGDENKETLRQQSVAALANSLRLAEQLGCHYVEIVAGSAVPESVQKSQADLSEARRERTQALCQSLREVFEQTEPTGGAAAGRLPSLCLEIEPGEVYLMDQVSRFAELRKELAKDTSFRWLDRVLLNIDLAHMMLTQGDEARSGSEVQEAAARQPDVMPWIGHMHMSDHARTHAADLCPGTYHFYPDYKPWLELAIELCQQKHNRFSGVVAVELEACGDIFEVVRAVGKTRRWIAHTARRFLSGENGHSPRLLEGALLVVDIGNSTACMTDKAPELIEGCVTRICQTVHRHRGSVYSFTGDGVIALFDMAHFSSRKEAADYSWQVVEALPGAVAGFMDAEEPDPPYLRAALHWGREVRVPTGGSLRYQAIGREVVIACRLCGCADDDLGKTKHPKMNVIASADWLNAKGEQRPCKPRDLKGITQPLDAAAWKWTPEGL